MTHPPKENPHSIVATPPFLLSHKPLETTHSLPVLVDLPGPIISYEWIRILKCSLWPGFLSLSTMLSEFIGFLASITASSIYARIIPPNMSLPRFVYLVLSQLTLGFFLSSIINNTHILYKHGFSIFSNTYLGVVTHTHIASVYPSEELGFCNPALFLLTNNR